MSFIRNKSHLFCAVKTVHLQEVKRNIKNKAETREYKWVFSTSNSRYDWDSGKDRGIWRDRELAGSTYDWVTDKVIKNTLLQKTWGSITHRYTAESNDKYPEAQFKDNHRISFILYNACFIEVQLSNCHRELQIWSSCANNSLMDKFLELLIQICHTIFS